MYYSAKFILLSEIYVETLRGQIFNFRELVHEPTECWLGFRSVLIWSQAYVICKMPYFVIFSDLLILKLFSVLE